jgi:hypothetical protein
MDSRKIFCLTLCCFLIIIILFSGCTSLNPEPATNDKNQNLEQNTVLTSNGKSIEVNLINSNILSKSPSGSSSVYEFIFEVKNTRESGITIYYPIDPNSGGAYYDVWLEDYGGFKHDIMVYGVYEKLADGSYKNNLKNVGGASLKIYPNEKILIGCVFLPKKADIDKLNVKTFLHFSFGGKSERTWDVTSLFKT